MRATPVLVCGRRTTCWRGSTSPMLTPSSISVAGLASCFLALRARFPNAQLTGVDQSAAMLAKAAQADAAAMLIEADAALWRPDRPVVLIYSNALLQWVPGHEELMPALLACCRTLAEQMPANFDFAVPAADRRAGQGGAVARSSGRSAVRRKRAAGQRLHRHSEGLPAPRSISGRPPITSSCPAPIRCWTGCVVRPCCGSMQPWAVPTARQRSSSSGNSPCSCERPTPADADGITIFPFKRLFFVASR